MKKFITIAFASIAFSVATYQANAQTKFGYISTQELITAMPEFKKADTALADYQQALNLQYQDMVEEFNLRDSLLKVKPSKFTPAQIDIKTQELQQLYAKLQGWQENAQNLYQKKQQELMTPIYDKARKAIQDVAKESGYTYVFNKEQLLASPPGDDILPLVKKKLNVK
jgi:outer membrane protein